MTGSFDISGEDWSNPYTHNPPRTLGRGTGREPTMNRAGPRGTLVLLVLSLVWFAAMLWSAQANITGTGTAVGALIQVADALPVVVAAGMLGGAAAGLVAFWYLRRTAGERRFPVYLAAGAFPGVLLLLSEGVTLVGGAQVFHAVGAQSSADQAVVDYLANSRLNHALILLFVGALVALLCLGRTLRPAETGRSTKVG